MNQNCNSNIKLTEVPIHLSTPIISYALSSFHPHNYPQKTKL